MRPSISMSLEPGLERGAPTGHDLYTFVTSAAGHMMRTLQKPRKNRPSKRQVNHRRFLHNMIQRKFADIEAANHRLSSALHFKEGEKNMSSLSSNKLDTPDQSGNPSHSGHLQDPDKCSVHTDTDGTSKSRTDVSIDLDETEAGEKDQPESGHLWKRYPKSQSSICTNKTNKKSKRRKEKGSRSHKLVAFTCTSCPTGTEYDHGAEIFHTECYNNKSHLKPIDSLSEDTPTPLIDSSFIHQCAQNMDISPPFSPELSLLSLDSCDFSIQMFTDLTACTEAQKSIADITEGQLSDIMDLFGVGNKDLGGCMDVEAYFESICGCQGDAGPEVSADVTFADQSDNCEVEDVHCEEAQYSYEYGCSGDQGLTSSHFQSNQRSSQAMRQSAYTAEEQLNSFKSFQSADITQNQLPTSISYHYNVTQLQTYPQPQGESPCMLINCDNNLHFTPFEGVAQSFSAPLHNPEHRPIATPPHEHDWLFTDILKDSKSPEY